MGMKWFSVGKQSQLCKENIHHTVTPPSLLTADTWHEGCCAFAKFGPYHLNVAAETDNRQHVSNLLFSNFGKPVQTVAQVFSRQEWDPMWSSVDAAHLLQFKMLCIQRCSSAQLGCNKWLFKWLLHFYQLLTAAHQIFSLLQTILYKHMRRLCGKIPIDQQFLKYSDKPVLRQQQQLYHGQSPLSFFLLHSSAQWTSVGHLSMQRWSKWPWTQVLPCDC